MLAPVAIFAYNRPKYLKLCLESLKANNLSKETQVYFFIDYIKSKKDLKKNTKVKKIINSINFFKKKIIIKRKVNFGLKKNIIDGINHVLKKHDKVIVVEDDLYLSKCFLDYMNSNLEFYKNSNSVASIHGYCYPINYKSIKENFFFIRGADCWGWGTWKRSWNIYCDDSILLANKLKKSNQIVKFNFNNSFNFYNALLNAGNNLWAVKWYASAFLSKKLTLYPKRTYVINLGTKGIGTNTEKIDNRFDSKLNDNFTFEKIKIKENKFVRKAFENFFKYNFKKKYFLIRLMLRLSKLLKNV
jgi:hypothetical protein